MKIGGFQPLSLLDYPGKPCSIIFTQGCIFRCSYCHNPDLIPVESASAYTQQEIIERLEKRKKIVDAVCITGGEPTIHSGLSDLIQQLKRKGFFVKLDTNGIHPSVIKNLIEKELVDYIAMDIKAPWEKYDQVIQLKSQRVIEACMESFQIIQDSSIEHEFRTTIAPGVHIEEDFFSIAGYLQPEETYYIQNTRFETTLDPDISRVIGYDISSMVSQLQTRFPALIIHER